MTNSDNTQSPPKNIKSKAVSFKEAESVVTTEAPWQNRRGTKVALGFSLFVALIVIFALPQLIPENKNIEENTKDRVVPVKSIKESPFIDAQLLKARRESQDSLSRFLANQDFLENKNVGVWGQDAFEDAIKVGAKGDLLYRQRNFNGALILYEEAGLKLDELKSRIPEELFINLKVAENAFFLGNVEKSVKYYGLALSIDPSNTKAKNGLKRTYVLNEVLALLKKASALLEEKRYEQAKKIYLEAIKLDPLSQEAVYGNKEASLLLAEKQFIVSMSMGYQALENEKFNLAVKEFQKAVKIKPTDSPAYLGLTQAKSLSMQKTIAIQLSNAVSNETKEKWKQASEIYKNVLTKNDSIIEAQLGQNRSLSRAKLSGDINKILAFPLRLSTTGVYEYAKTLLSEAQKIKSAGPKHATQISKLTKELDKSQINLIVQFRSNKSTNVTLLKNGILGFFNEKKISLKPGKYIVIGNRDGYRDVRIEFKVTPEEMPLSLEVICREPI